jgi:hypothetical protein
MEGDGMRTLEFCFVQLLVLVCLLVSRPDCAAATEPESPGTRTSQPSVVLVIGAAGEAEYGSNFLRQAVGWQEICARSGARVTTIGLSSAGGADDRVALQEALAAEPREGLGKLWVILVGHGTFDGRTAKFNLRGPDVGEEDLATWLKPVSRPTAILNTASASGPFLKKLSGTNRVVVCATRSGREQNLARLGQFLAGAIAEPESDLDKDGQVSLLEAFLRASRQVDDFYKAEGRLKTEHALLDDNGDGLGTPADWFRGIHARKKPKENAAVDGLLASQFVLVPSATEAGLSDEKRARRDQLEKAVYELRGRKPGMPEESYYRQLEQLMLELAQVYKD